jgi:hypothetical protein
VAAGGGRVAKGYKGIKIKCFVFILFSYSKLIWQLLIGGMVGKKLPLFATTELKLFLKLHQIKYHNQRTHTI